jgi:hypothetical protein
LEFILKSSASSGEIDRLSLPIIDLYVSALTSQLDSSEAASHFAGNTAFMFLSRKWKSRQRAEQDDFQVPRGRDLNIDSILVGQGRKIVAPLPLFSWAMTVRLPPKL